MEKRMLIITEKKVCHAGHDDSKLAAQLCLLKAQIDMMKGNDTERFPISCIWYFCMTSYRLMQCLLFIHIHRDYYPLTKEMQSTPVDFRWGNNI